MALSLPYTVKLHPLHVTLQLLPSRVEPISFPLGPGVALSLTWITTDYGGRDGVPVQSLGPKGSLVLSDPWPTTSMILAIWLEAERPHEVIPAVPAKAPDTGESPA